MLPAKEAGTATQSQTATGTATGATIAVVPGETIRTSPMPSSLVPVGRTAAHANQLFQPGARSSFFQRMTGKMIYQPMLSAACGLQLLGESRSSMCWRDVSTAWMHNLNFYFVVSHKGQKL